MYLETYLANKPSSVWKCEVCVETLSSNYVTVFYFGYIKKRKAKLLCSGVFCQSVRCSPPPMTRRLWLLRSRKILSAKYRSRSRDSVCRTKMGQYQIHLCWLSKILFCPLPTSIEAIWSPFYWHGLILTQPWISNDNRYKVWGWIISSHTLLGMWLPIHAALMWNKLSWHCHCPPFWWICMIISMLIGDQQDKRKLPW